MRYAKVENSERLQRTLAVLKDGCEHTTRDLIQEAHICAVNSCVAELNAQGYVIVCRRSGDRWYYRLQSEPFRLRLIA